MGANSAVNSGDAWKLLVFIAVLLFYESIVIAYKYKYSRCKSDNEDEDFNVNSTLYILYILFALVLMFAFK